MRVGTLGVRSPAMMYESIEVEMPQASATRCCSPRISPERENSIDKGAGSRPEPPQWRHTRTGRAVGAGVSLIMSSRAVAGELMRQKYTSTSGRTGILTTGEDCGYAQHH